MASPVIVSNTATVQLVPFNRFRKTLLLQNTGTSIVYVKKQIPGALVSEPSATNFDFELPAFSAGNNNIIQINSVAAFRALAVTAPSAVGVMETSITIVV